MSDYKSMRIKKNAQLMEAMSNIRKDLYDWKPSSVTVSRVPTANTTILQSPIFPAPPAKLKSLDSNLILKRTNSLKDLQKKDSTGIKTKNVSANTKLKKLDLQDFLEYEQNKKKTDIKSEFLSSFKSNSMVVDNSNSDLFLQRDDRPYLNSARHFVMNSSSSNKLDKDLDKELVEKLNQNNALSVFEMDLSQFNLKSMKNLQKFQNLKIIDFSCNKIKKIEFLNFKNLIELRLYANQIEYIENLENVPELQSLQLQSNKIKQLDKGLSSLKKLEYLRLDQNELESIKTSEIAACSNLIYLNLSSNKLQSIGFVNCLSNLEELNASNLNLRNINDLDANRLKKLDELDLSSNQQLSRDIQNLACLSNFKNLSTLKLTNNGLKSIKPLTFIRSLKYLDISNNEIELIQELANLIELQTLDISSNKITHWLQIESLVNCKELFDLNCKNNPVLNDKTFIDISNALPNLLMINEQPVEQRLETKTNKNDKNELIQMQNDLNKFQQDMQLFDQQFQKRFQDIKEYLNSIDQKINRPESSKTSARLSNSANSKKLSKNRLMDALYFSKQLGDKQESTRKVYSYHSNVLRLFTQKHLNLKSSL